jgi:hypothetical protein
LDQPNHSFPAYAVSIEWDEQSWPQFREACPQTGLEKVSRFTPQASFVALFSGGYIGSPVSTTQPGECNAITTDDTAKGDLDFSKIAVAQVN